MKQILIITLSLFLLNHTSSAQNILLYEDVSTSTEISRIGPNRLHFHHFYYTYGKFFDSSEKGSDIIFLNSYDWGFGYRYKLRINNFYAVGTDLAYYFKKYRLAQNNDKILPNSILNDKESFAQQNLKLGFYNRFNFGKRGNHIGRYLDFGIFGSFNTSTNHNTVNKMPNGNVVSTTISKLTYTEKTNWGLDARIGSNRWAIWGSYRMSNFFKESASLPELPRLTVGIELGLF